jgi:two-component system, response regulator
MKDRDTLLLVEDNPDDAALAMRALRNNKIANQVVLLEDGAQALDYLFGTGEFRERDISKTPCLILLDLKLPRIDGLDVLKRIRSDWRTKLIPVVILTSSSEERDMVESYDLGANSYIIKPVDFEQFVEAVQTLGLYWLVLNEPPPKPKAH